MTSLESIDKGDKRTNGTHPHVVGNSIELATAAHCLKGKLAASDIQSCLRENFITTFDEYDPNHTMTLVFSVQLAASAALVWQIAPESQAATFDLLHELPEWQI